MSEVTISFPDTTAGLQGEMKLPASKSISNRVLIIQALCAADFKIHNLSDATDTHVLLDALKTIKENSTIQTIDVHDAGTSFRFLTAYLSCQESKEFILKGNTRMHKRPIADLVNALKEMGADITYIEQDNYPPLLIKGRKLKGGNITINGNVSSQFISALCLIAPVLEEGLVIEIRDELVSYSYIQMTLQLMVAFGIKYTFQNSKITIPHQQYTAKDFTIENDWSSATLFYGMAMLSESASFDFDLLKEKSVQGDSYIKHFANDFDIQTIFENDKVFIKKSNTPLNKPDKSYDLNSYPDLAIPVIVACAVKCPDVKFTGLKHLQYKESDRLAALTAELKKVNIILHYENDILSFDNTHYKPSKETIRFNTYNDHRIAMTLSMLALEGFTVVLDDGDCVSKSFAGFFEELGEVGFEIGI